MMSSDRSAVNLYGADSLCFDKDAFMMKNFSVDTFVQIHQASGSTGLDTLRDDLGVYLKILRSAMIDLINRDYADFVNLSTNLTGLDSIIDSLKVPLEQLRGEVLSVESSLSSAVEFISSDLKKRNTINKQKSLLHCINQISIRLDRLESLLKMEAQDQNHSAIKTGNDLVDRLATEVNHLNFLVAQCEGTTLVDTFKPRVETVCNFVEVGLERGLLEGIQENNKQLLIRTLRTYAGLGTVQHAYQQVRALIQCRLEEVISDQALKSDPRGLRGMYEKCLATVQKVCCSLIEVTTGTGSDVVGGFSFLEEAVWPEIVSALESRAQFIFNPGNPLVFHERYLESLRFLEEFEVSLKSDEKIVSFRESNEYHKFWELWNLPVYFQIRYQEIGYAAEAAFSDQSGGLEPCCDRESDFKLNATHTMWQSLLKCFSPDIFLVPLLHRFWKLWLLIMSRYRMWVLHVINKIKVMKSDRVNATADGLAELLKAEAPHSGLASSIAILHDIHLLMSKLENYFEIYIQPQIAHIPNDKKTIMKDVISLEVEKMTEVKSELVDVLVGHLAKLSCNPLKQVADTPRIYRRTNKPVPTVHQQYISSSIRPIIRFHELSKAAIQDDEISRVHRDVFTTLASQFLNLVGEVLSSVQKMEESLRRLKQARDRGTQPGLDSSVGHSDDDKIRIQIYLDVIYLGDQMVQLGIDRCSIKQYQSLLTLVENAKDAKSL